MCVSMETEREREADQVWQKYYHLMNLDEVIRVFIILFFDISQHKKKHTSYLVKCFVLF